MYKSEKEWVLFPFLENLSQVYITPDAPVSTRFQNNHPTSQWCYLPNGCHDIPVVTNPANTCKTQGKMRKSKKTGKAVRTTTRSSKFLYEANLCSSICSVNRTPCYHISLPSAHTRTQILCKTPLFASSLYNLRDKEQLYYDCSTASVNIFSSRVPIP